MKAAIGILALLLLAVPTTILAQNYPDKPIRIIVGFAAGGGTDIAARLIAPKLSEGLGQPVIVENRPGAANNIAIGIVAKAAPDGYTLLMGTPSVVVNKYVYKKLPFDASRDLVGLSLFSVSPNVLVVNPSVPAKNIRELIALAHARPGKLTFSSAGYATSQHLSGELFNLRAKVNTLHVPYKGAAPSLVGLISGEVDISYCSIPAIIPHIKSGQLRALASAGEKRAELMPDVPTLKESGLDMEITAWYGVLAPSGTPRAIIDRLSGLLKKIAHSPEMKKSLADLGSEPVGSTPEEFAKFLNSEDAQWAEVVKVTGVKVD
jgi:tripartite-type tricarboxylate transporter receptor subunit TctC